MWTSAKFTMIVLAFMTPLSVQADTEPKDIDVIVDATIQKLKANTPSQAIESFFKGTNVPTSKASEIQYLVGQIESTLKVYGPITECELVDTKTRGSMAIKRQYLCQHDTLLTRWSLTFTRGSKGWKGNNILFDDKAFSTD